MSSHKYVAAICIVPIGYGRSDYVCSEISKVLMYMCLKYFFLHYYNKGMPSFYKRLHSYEIRATVNTDFR